jgi:bacterioferritin (cytochrome b1)
METLGEKNREKAVDVLSERLAFERAGVRLYDRILEVLREHRNEGTGRLTEVMQEHRNEEKEHEEFLEDQVRRLGASAHQQTDRVKLVTKESEGILQVVMSETRLPHLFHALLSAELVDNAGWDLLVQLADEAGDYVAKRAFKKRLHEEERHLELARKVVHRLTVQEVLELPQKLPGAALEAVVP